MYRRYVIVGIFFFLLIGAYFVFFDKEKTNKEYNKYYEKLVSRKEYKDSLDGIMLSIDEVKENDRYDYIITFDNVDERKDNVKILVVDSKTDKNDKRYYPSFGIVNDQGYSIIKNNEDITGKETKGVNLMILDTDRIEEILIYFSSNENEQFVKINVSHYLN